MASALSPASRTVARSLAASALRQPQQTSHILRATASFSTSTARHALPAGPPPKGYRLPSPKPFDAKESVMDRASNYFLLTEMFRGMYVVLEQFFRPPYVQTNSEAMLSDKPLIIRIDTRYTTRTRKVLSRHDSEVSMLCDDTLLARSAASPVSSARPFVPPAQSQSKPRRERTDREEQPGTIST